MASKIAFWKWLADRLHQAGMRLHRWHLRGHISDLRQSIKQCEAAARVCDADKQACLHDAERYRNYLRRAEAKLISINYEMGHR